MTGDGPHSSSDVGIGTLREGTAGWTSGRFGGSRRRFLRRVVGGGLAVGAASALAGCEHDTDVNPTPNNSGSLPTRKSISSLQQSDPDNVLQAFEDGVQQMKNLSSSDARSWDNIAEIHGDAQNFIHCRHGGWLFLPWHRAYLAFFEDIIRELSGNEDFALPYWNWAANPQLPSIFTDSSSPLYDSTRSSDPDPDGPDTDQSEVQSILNEPNFQRFAGRPSGGGKGDVESPSHDTVHVDVGGGWPDPGNMASTNSPLDPVFWVHHCMVDCIWWEWNWGQGNPNTNDSSWTDATFTDEFVDRNGDDVEEISVQDTLWIPLESHAMYETNKGSEETPADTDERREFIEQGATVELETASRVPIRQELEVQPGSFHEVEIGPKAIEEIRPFVTGEQEGRIDLAFRDMSLPALSGAQTRVFVDQPKPIVDAPREDPRFAGGFAFFKGPATEGPSTRFVNVTDVLRRIAKEDELFERDELHFQIASIPDADEPPEELREQTYFINNLNLEVTQSFITDHPLETDERTKTDEQSG